MRLSEFDALKNKYEHLSFEKNYMPLSKTLFYFSFLGNVFIVLFSFFFLKNITDSIPHLFTGQEWFFGVFITLFMVGYELFKRFSFEQLMGSIFVKKTVNLGSILGGFVVALLVAGSFYLSLNGSHRLIDTSATTKSILADQIQQKTDSIHTLYAPDITLYKQQLTQLYNYAVDGKLPSKYKKEVAEYEQKIAAIEAKRDAEITKVSQEISSSADATLNATDQNRNAFVLLVFFLEAIVLVGVGFHSYYNAKSYLDMKTLLKSPKYKQLELNVRLLDLFYQNGKKKEGDPTVSFTKFKSMVKSQKMQCTQSEVTDFLNLLTELEVIQTESKSLKTYAVSLEKAKELFEAQFTA